MAPGILSMLGGGLPKTASEPLPPFEAPDVSTMTDREILGATYLEIAQARHLLTAVLKNAADGPLGAMFPRFE